MNFNFWTKLWFIGFSLLMFFGCQNQTVSNSTNQPNSNVALKNSNTANHKIAEISAPQNIKFTSEGNVEIVGTFYESPKVDSPAVLLLHQFNSNRKSYDLFAKQLQKNGFGVLAIDGRGFGESTKTTDGKTVAAEKTDEAVKGMKADVANAFDFLAKQKNVDAGRIGIVGASYGSSLALIYGAENEKVKTVALLSPGLNYFGNMPTEPAVKIYGDRPLLLVAAEDDQESADAVRKLKQTGANDKYGVKIYEKGGHGTDIVEANFGLSDLLEDFFKKSL